jgi:hypothetical protein
MTSPEQQLQLLRAALDYAQKERDQQYAVVLAENALVEAKQFLDRLAEARNNYTHELHSQLGRPDAVSVPETEEVYVFKRMPAGPRVGTLILAPLTNVKIAT